MIVTFFAHKARCKYFFGIIDFLEILIEFFDIPNLFNFNSIFAISTISTFFFFHSLSLAAF